MSLVGPKDDLVHDRISDMARKGVVFVAAAGNGGPDAAAGYPAAYEEVIAVTAVDRKGGNYDHANRGTYIDVAAPGVQIRTALPGGKDGVPERDVICGALRHGRGRRRLPGQRIGACGEGRARAARSQEA